MVKSLTFFSSEVAQTKLEIILNNNLPMFPSVLIPTIADYIYDAKDLLEEYVELIDQGSRTVQETPSHTQELSHKLKLEKLLIQSFSAPDSFIAFAGNKLKNGNLFGYDDRLAVFFERRDTPVRETPQVVFFLIYELYELFGLASERKKDFRLRTIETNLTSYQDFCNSTPKELKNALKLRYLLAYFGDMQTFSLMQTLRASPQFQDIAKKLLLNTPHINFSFLSVDAGFFTTLKNVNFFGTRIAHQFPITLCPDEMVGVDLLNADFVGRKEDEQANQKLIMRHAPATLTRPGYEKFHPLADYLKTPRVKWQECVHALRMMKARNSHELLLYFTDISQDLLQTFSRWTKRKEPTGFALAFNEVLRNFQVVELKHMPEHKLTIR